MIRKLLPLFGLLAVFVAAGAAVSQTESFERDVERWLQALDSIEQRLAEGDLPADEIDQLRSHVETIQQEARNAKADAEARLTTPKRELEALGPAPSEQQAEGADGAAPPAETPQESESLAARRAALEEQVRELEGQIKQAELVITRAQEVLRHLSSISSARFTQELLARGPSPLDPQTWAEAFDESKRIFAELLANPGEWWRASGPQVKGWTPWLVSLVAGFVVAALLLLLRRWLTGRYGRKREIEAPSFSRRTLAAAVDGFTGGLGPSMALAAFAGLLEHFELASLEATPLLYGVGWGLIVYWVVGELVRAVFAPRAPQWRLVPFSSEISRLLGLQCQGLVLYLAIVTAIFVAVRGDAGMDALDPSFRACFMLVINSMTAFFLSFLLGGWLWRPQVIEMDHAAEEPEQSEAERRDAAEGGQDEDARSAALPPSARFARFVIGVVLLAMPVTALFGYTMLSSYIASRFIQLAFLLGVTFLLLTILKEGLQALFAPESGRIGPLARLMGMSRLGGERTVFWMKLLVQAAVFAFLITVVLLLLGIPESALSLWISEFLEGVTIGGFTFSPGGIIVGIALFVAGIFLTRLITRYLRDNLLPKTRMDAGVRHSLTAAANYTGIIIAAMIGISALGLDLSNLAIIAGALSVGIGFGLREVVNNFVSGLLLLIERPIKVGDWVEVAGYHGTVKKISVRSTEIQTFDRSEVIVPNSELIAGSVVNWTHRNRMARIIVSVGVAYGSDTEKVREILRKAAEDHEDILDVPAPQIYFMDFGDSSLNFELRAYLRDTDYILTAPSELRFAIDKAFRQEGVEIPFPQRDINFRTSLRTGPVAAQEEGAAQEEEAAQPAAEPPGEKGATGKEPPDKDGESS